MKKGIGKKAQARGHKRRAKVVAKKHKTVTNLEYIVKLMGKYGKDLKLKESDPAGTKFIQDYLRPTTKEDDVKETN